jgi:DNA-directed RNA polymerase beta subunit
MANYTNTYNEIYNAMCEVEEILNHHIDSYEEFIEHKDVMLEELNKIQNAIDSEYEVRKALGGKFENLVKELM